MDAVTTAKELNLLYMKVFIQRYTVNLYTLFQISPVKLHNLRTARHETAHPRRYSVVIFPRYIWNRV